MKKKPIDPNVFILAARRIIPEHEGCCSAITLVGYYGNEAEMRLFKRMFARWPLPYDIYSKIPNSGWWFGARNDPNNQRLRQQCLLETAINLKEQGFVK